MSSKRRIIFVPYAGLHWLPLHAMFTENRGERHYVMDDHLVSYAPSSSLLKLCIERPSPRPRRAFVAWSNPRNDLNAGQCEATAIARLLGTRVNKQITADELPDMCRNGYVFHFVGHAEDGALILDSGSDHKEQRFDLLDVALELELRETWLATSVRVTRAE